MSLVGVAYIQPSVNDPGAVGFGYSWMQSDTGNIYFRSNDNTQWVLAGNTDQTYMGTVSRTGATMTGAITGAHGIMPLTGGDFTNPPTINGQAIATQAYVLDQIFVVNSSVSVSVAQAIASIPGVTASAQISLASGVSASIASGGTFTIPLPTYGDGTTASSTDVSGRYGAWVMSVPSHLTPGFVSLVETAPGSRTYTYTEFSSVSAILGYYITGIKS